MNFPKYMFHLRTSLKLTRKFWSNKLNCINTVSTGLQLSYSTYLIMLCPFLSDLDHDRLDRQLCVEREGYLWQQRLKTDMEGINNIPGLLAKQMRVSKFRPQLVLSASTFTFSARSPKASSINMRLISAYTILLFIIHDACFDERFRLEHLLAAEAASKVSAH